jgi:hypothetical protein
VNDKIYGQPDNVFINYIDKETRNEPKMARHSLHSAKLSFIWLDLPILCEIKLPTDLSAIWAGSDLTSDPAAHPTELAV